MSHLRKFFYGDEGSEIKNSKVPQTTKTIQSLWNLQKIILDTLDFNEVVERIVDGLLLELGYLDLGYRIIVLTLVDEKKQVLKRISLSRTEEARKAIEASCVPFHDIDIPLNANKNILIQTLKTKNPHVTHNWKDIFIPVLSEEDALKNQHAANIKTSMTYPVVVRGKAIGVLIFSMVKNESAVSAEERNLIAGFTEIVGLAVQNSQLYSSLEESKERIQRANRRLKELDKLKDEFVSVASHELRTPMTAIKSYLWMALDGKGGKLSEKQKYYIQRGYNSVDRLIRLVNDMLNISRIESGRITVIRKPIDLQMLIREVVNEVTPRAQEVGVTVIFNKSQQEEIVIADGDKIKEVLFNLIGNSIKFTPPKGTITVSLNHTDGFIQTLVKDTGTGIPAEDLGKLFQKFGLLAGSYTTNQPAMGTGLGLYISKSIMNMHEGKIWAASEGKGKGATFTFALKKPSKADLEQAAEEKHEETEEVGIIHSSI